MHSKYRSDAPLRHDGRSCWDCSCGSDYPRAIDFWLLITVLAIGIGPLLARLFAAVKYEGALLAMSVVLAIGCEATAEVGGLTFIIGAYSADRGSLGRTLRADCRKA